MSGTALLLRNVVTGDIGTQLALLALNMRACMLILAWSCAAVAALRWARVIYTELHRFIVLFRQAMMLPLCTIAQTHLRGHCMLCYRAAFRVACFSLGGDQVTHNNSLLCLTYACAFSGCLTLQRSRSCWAPRWPCVGQTTTGPSADGRISWAGFSPSA